MNGLRSFNPFGVVSDRLYDEVLRKRYFRGIQFTDPAGDPGWFGPDSAVWYVLQPGHHAPAPRRPETKSAVLIERNGDKPPQERNR